MTKVLVTGASGLLGSSVVQYCADKCEVVGTYLSHPVDFAGVRCLQADLTDENQYGPLKQFDPDVIIHCAALTDVDQCEQEPQKAYNINVDITRKLVTLADSLGARFIHLSTDAVFDGTEGLYTETDEANPINVYGRTKLTAEQVVTEAQADSIIVRTNIYGWNATDGQSLAEWMLEKLRDGEELPAFRDAYFSPIYTGTLASILFELISRDINGVMHISSPNRYSKLSFAEHLADVFDLNTELIVPTSIDDVDFSAPRGRDLSLSVSRAQHQLNCDLPTAREGLEQLKRDEYE